MEAKTYLIPVIIKTEAVVQATTLKEAYQKIKKEDISFDGFEIDYSSDVSTLETKE